MIGRHFETEWSLFDNAVVVVAPDGLQGWALKHSQSALRHRAMARHQHFWKRNPSIPSTVRRPHITCRARPHRVDVVRCRCRCPPSRRSARSSSGTLWAVVCLFACSSGAHPLRPRDTVGMDGWKCDIINPSRLAVPTGARQCPFVRSLFL